MGQTSLHNIKVEDFYHKLKSDAENWVAYTYFRVGSKIDYKKSYMVNSSYINYFFAEEEVTEELLKGQNKKINKKHKHKHKEHKDCDDCGDSEAQW